MNNILIKTIGMATILIVTSLNTNAQVSATGDEKSPAVIAPATSIALTEQFIAAIKGKDEAKWKALVHPRCFIGLTPIQKQYAKQYFENLIADVRVIPGQQKVRISKISLSADGKPSTSPDLSLGLPDVSYFIKPTHYIGVEFGLSGSTTTICADTAEENGHWYIIIPVMKDADLKKMSEEASKAQGASCPR